MPETQETKGNLIITGFMGTGKSVIGRAVAERLARRFVDMDTEIEARAGKRIRRIFSEDGEAAFRDMEARLCEELSSRDGYVIATGGGTLVTPRNRAVLREEDMLICLHAEPGDILRRVSGGEERPLLQVRDPRAEIERLLTLRQDAYAALPWHVDTSRLPVERVVERVLALAEARTVRTDYPGGAYHVQVGTGLLHHIGGALRAAAIPAGTRVALVSNDVVAPLYAAEVEQSLSAAYLHPFRCVVPDGERHKTLRTVSSLYEQFLAGGLDRTGLVLSLGGGVTGDIAGFAAASFLRGIYFAQVPTTLLAMVDASVGGKTGVDLRQGKNLVGAFKQPHAVVIDPQVLSTLADPELRSGMAEVIKHGIIGAPSLFGELEVLGRASQAPGNQPCLLSPEQLTRALRVKIDIVEEDPYEHGRRAALNLGHTVGHAIERVSGYTLRHGEAVSIGTVAAARIALRLGRAEHQLARRIESVLAAWGLPIRCEAPGHGPFRAEDVWQAMAHDKKRQADSLRWVLPLGIGRVIINVSVPRRLVLSVLREMGATGSVRSS